MRARAFVLGAATVVLLGVGIWLGRSSWHASDGGTGEPGARPPVAVEPAQVPPRARAASLPVLARKATPPTSALASDLRDADPKVRRAAIREVAAAGDVDPAVLLAASRDPDLEVAITATSRLGKLHAEGAVPVQEMIARASDRSLAERVRGSALSGLGTVASPEAAQTLIALLQRGDSFERRNAAALLQNQDPELAIPALIDALADADELVRANALESLRARSRGRDFGSDANGWRGWWQSRSR